MKIVSFNVNGIRAIVKKDFLKFFNENKADIFCIQETKIHDSMLTDEIINIGALNGYKGYFFGAEKKGYSSTAIFSKIEPQSVKNGIGDELFDGEGRVQTFELKDAYLVNVYVPNSKPGLARIKERLDFNKKFINHCEKLRKVKPVIFCGDLNVAHKPIDLARPDDNEDSPGFSIFEREAFDSQLDKGYIDTFRMFNKKGENYTWWSYRTRARDRNIGWRIDYFIVSEELKNKVKSSTILSEVMGSDHCPVQMEIDIK
jgi:exodeoxyribonuclease-3